MGIVTGSGLQEPVISAVTPPGLGVPKQAGEVAVSVVGPVTCGIDGRSGSVAEVISVLLGEPAAVRSRLKVALSSCGALPSLGGA
jgi:hypothetical protein